MARWYCPESGMKISNEAFEALKTRVPTMKVVPYHHNMYWAFAVPQSVLQGLLESTFTAGTRLVEATAGLLTEPIGGGIQGWQDGQGALKIPRTVTGIAGGAFCGVTGGVDKVFRGFARMGIRS